jgi:hypothetical protein
LKTTGNGAWSDARSLKRRARAPIAVLLAAVGALVLLLASFAGAAFAADDDPPITAADVAPATPSGAAPATADSSSAPAHSIVEAPPLAAPPAAAAGSAIISAEPPSESLPGARPASLTPELPTRPTFTTPAVPPIDHPGNDAALVGAPGTQEIPQANPQETPVAMVPPSQVPSSPDMNNYMNEDPNLAGSLGSTRDFVEEGQGTSPQTLPIGFEVRESSCRLKTGEQIDGLLIMKVYKDSPAAKAGLQPYKNAKEHALQAVAIGAGIAFPPAMLLTMVALPMIEYTEMGKSYDMIIGVDGARVNNFFDFEERMRSVQPGELVYLNLVRNGKRMQIAIPIPALSTSASN